MKVKICVGFSTGKGFAPLAWAIRARLNTKYSHTYIHLHESDQIFEAVMNGVRITSRESWLKKNKIIKEVETEITFEEYVELRKFINESVGKSYGKFQLFVILFNLPMDNGDKRYICSELVARGLQRKLGIMKEKLDKITPKNIWKLVHERFANG